MIFATSMDCKLCIYCIISYITIQHNYTKKNILNFRKQLVNGKQVKLENVTSIVK